MRCTRTAAPLPGAFSRQRPALGAETPGRAAAVQQFAEYFGRSPEHLGAAELPRYQLYLLHEKKLALGTVENCISSLRFLYKKTLKRRDLAFDDLPFPKQPHKLPTVLSQDEVTRHVVRSQSKARTNFPQADDPRTGLACTSAISQYRDHAADLVVTSATPCNSATDEKSGIRPSINVE